MKLISLMILGFLTIIFIIVFICSILPKTIFDCIIYTTSQPTGFLMKDYIKIIKHDINTISVIINNLTFSLIGGIYSQNKNIFSNIFYLNNGTWNRINTLNEISNKELIIINLISSPGETNLTYKKIDSTGKIIEVGMLPNSASIIFSSPLI